MGIVQINYIMAIRIAFFLFHSLIQFEPAVSVTSEFVTEFRDSAKMKMSLAIEGFLRPG